MAENDKEEGHTTWPALDLPAQAASAGACEGCGDRPASTPRGVRSDAAGACLPVHDWRTRRAADRERRGPRGRTVHSLHRRDRGQGRGVPAVGSPIRQAARLGLLTIQERRREGQKNLPNIVRGSAANGWCGYG